MSRLLRSENLLVALLLAIIAFYVYDTVRGSLAMANVIFIVPIGGIALALGIAALLAGNVNAGERGEGERPAPRARPRGLGDPRVRSTLMLALFIVYVGLMFLVPFDVIAWLFVAASLWVLGERGKLMLAVYPLLFAFATAFAFRWLLPYPMNTLV